MPALRSCYRLIALLPAVLALYASLAGAKEPRPSGDSWVASPDWFGPDQSGDDSHMLGWQDRCPEVDPAWVLPVLAERRDEAAALLESRDAITLDDDAVSLWTGQPPAGDGSAAARLMTNEIDSLLEQRDELLENGTWDEARLDALRTLIDANASDAVQPYLVRAVVKELTYGFSARSCSDGLMITHWSIGNAELPPTSRAPIVVFLAEEPARVFPMWGWGYAEAWNRRPPPRRLP